MAHRHRKHKAAGGREVYTGKGSKVEHEAESKSEDFKRGGRRHHVGRAAGGRAKKSFARGGRASPFSSAAGSIKGKRGFASPIMEHKGQKHGEHLDHEAHGGGVDGGHMRHGHKGKARHQYAKGGRAEDDGEEEDEGCGMKKGGATLHYKGGGGKHKKAHGGAVGGHAVQRKIAGHDERLHEMPHPGSKNAMHLDVERAKDGGRKWVGKAFGKHPGALHKSLGVPQGEKIPAKKLAKAERSENPKIAKRAQLAETAKSFHHAVGGTVSGAPSE
jgi:hypothetical protein